MPRVFEPRHGHYLIRIFLFIRRMRYQSLVFPNPTLVQVTPEIHPISLIDKIGHHGTVHPHRLGHVSQFEIRIEEWFLLRQIVFERRPVQLSAGVIRPRVLFGDQTVVPGLIFIA